MTRREAFNIWRTYDVLRGVILSLTAELKLGQCGCCNRIGKHSDFSFCSAMGGTNCCERCFRTPVDVTTVNTYCGSPFTYDDTPQWGLQYAVDYKMGHPEEFQMYPDGALATI